MIALLPPSSSSAASQSTRDDLSTDDGVPCDTTPSRRSAADRRSADHRFARSSSSVPMTRPKRSQGSQPSTGWKTSCVAHHVVDDVRQGDRAQSGVTRLGFQIMASPHTAATIAFHAHTAMGKLNAVMMPIVPDRDATVRTSGADRRSLCIVSP